METKINKLTAELTNLLITKIKSFRQNPSSPKQWLKNQNLLIFNITGRPYKGFNAFYLSLVMDVNNYELPFFLTFKQAQQIGLKINKGAKASSVYFVSYMFRDKDGKLIDKADRDNLTDEDQMALDMVKYEKSYSVFNIEQTNIKEADANLFIELTNSVKSEKTENKIIENIDKLMQNWMCPILEKPSRQAFYSVNNDMITIPQRNMFINEQMFYSVLFHEMAHSTGHHSRLKRSLRNRFGSKDYAKEELIAELASAFAGQTLNIATDVMDHNVCYLESWLDCLNEEPEYLKSILKDAKGATKLIVDKFYTFSTSQTTTILQCPSKYPVNYKIGYGVA